MNGGLSPNRGLRPNQKVLISGSLGGDLLASLKAFPHLDFAIMPMNASFCKKPHDGPSP